MARDVRAEVSELAARHERSDPDLLRRVRDAIAPFARTGSAALDARRALAEVRFRARIDVDVPTASRRRRETWLKSAVKRLVRWYLSYLGDQVSVLGAAITRLGEAIVQRTEATEQATQRLSSRVDGLEERVAGLERRGGR